MIGTHCDVVYNIVKLCMYALILIGQNYSFSYACPSQKHCTDVISPSWPRLMLLQVDIYRISQKLNTLAWLDVGSWFWRVLQVASYCTFSIAHLPRHWVLQGRKSPWVLRTFSTCETAKGGLCHCDSPCREGILRSPAGCRSQRYFKAPLLFWAVQRQCTHVLEPEPALNTACQFSSKFRYSQLHPANSVMLYLEVTLTLPIMKLEESNSSLIVLSDWI